MTAARPARAWKIDREDMRSLYTSHWTRDGARTVCGLRIMMWQKYLGNGMCRRCERIMSRDRVALPAPHSTDADCASHLRDGICGVCGVAHAAPCCQCGQRGYHAPDCAQADG